MNPRKRRHLKLQAAQPAAPAPEPVVEVAPPEPEPVVEVEEVVKENPRSRRSSKTRKSS